MPTARQRHSITETPTIEEALDAAALIWPEMRSDRSALLRRLIESGHAAVAGRTTDRSASGRIRAAAGAATGVYPRDARRALSEEWPA